MQARVNSATWGLLDPCTQTTYALADPHLALNPPKPLMTIYKEILPPTL